jgi:glucose/arabinose dehydrogenase
LYFTIGDIRRNDDVQPLSTPSGKVYRILPDGSIPPDNPYVGKPGAIEAIFTTGNRNVQGIAQHPVTGAIWATEHGPMGGDELNILRLGRNYGWPVITYGLDYDGTPVSLLTEKEGLEQPIKYWKPSPGISALEFYTGDMFPKWKNQAFAGALVFQEIKRLKLGADKVEDEEVFLKGYGRVRDLKTGPDGAIYVLLNQPDVLLRLKR